MPILTDARNAVWDAINNWSGFAGDYEEGTVFKRQYKFDDDSSPELNPTPAQLPAIAIYPDPTTDDLVLHRRHESRYKLICMIFTETWNLATADEYWEELIKAAWQSDGGSGVPYVKNATGFYPRPEITLDQRRILVDGVKATLSFVGLTLQVRYDPQG